MKKNFFKGAALAALSLVGFTAIAQEEVEESTQSVLPFDLSGSVDANFSTNFNAPNGENNERFPTSFFGTDGFSVGLVNIVASKQVGKVGFVADIAVGPTANEAVAGEGTSSVVNQAFVTYAASESTTFTFGRFNTFLGYEVISPTGNFNYSTSYLFSAGPFSHTGLKADFALSEEFSLAAAILNSTSSDVDRNQDGKYTAGLQLGYAVDSGSAYLNILYGRDGISATDETFQIDLTTGWDLSEEFYLGFNGSYNDTDGEGFYGAALYPQYAVSEAFTLGLRGEFFGTLSDDSDAETEITSFTLTGSYTVGALTIKPELRLDSASEDIFVDDNPSATDPLSGSFQDNLSGFVLGAIYAF